MGLNRKWSAPVRRLAVLVLMALSLALTSFVWGIDRFEREPGDLDQSDGFVKRHPNSREVEPGDAAGGGDFTQKDPFDQELEPGDHEEKRDNPWGPWPWSGSSPGSL